MGKIKNAYNTSVRILKEKDYVRDLVVDGEIMLKLIFRR
jgi:hypothetical protein